MDKLEIIQGLKKGDDRVFDMVFTTLFPHLWRYASRIINDETEAEDITLEAFAKFYDRRTEFENYEGIKLFLYTITRNACISYLRSQTAQKNYIVNQQSESIIEEEKFFDTLDYQANLLEIVYREVNKLPRQCKKVFKLRFYKDYSYQQIAEKLKLSESAVRSHVTNALQKIRIVVRHKEMLVIFLSLYFF